MQTPFCNIEPVGQIQLFEMLVALIPHQHNPSTKNEFVVQQTQTSLIKLEPMGQVQIFDILTEFAGQVHSEFKIRAFLVMHLHYPSSNIEFKGQMHIFEEFIEYSGHSQAGLVSLRFITAFGVEQTQILLAKYDPNGQTHWLFYIRQSLTSTLGAESHQQYQGK
ncbi:Hypothetical_protein [Hexamita inflata]|uniref:Hypothetical_protein n=1 Tax=Hexamita inflata TaxID=28002 RepID=A0AA86U967_9EUKA|nr:Hypothetical protein HINF_LOCUS29957 [Hexamita inflata]